MENIQISMLDEADLSQFDNEVGITQNKNKRYDIAKTGKSSFGAVIYADSSFYANDPEIDKTKSLPDRDNVLKFLDTYFRNEFKIECDQILAGHEYGSTNSKAHFQLVITLKQRFQGYLKPFSFTIQDFKYLIMFQVARNSYALKNYCKKDGDFFYLYPDKAISYVYKVDNKTGLNTTKIDVFSTIVRNKDLLDKSEKMDLLMTHEPRTAMTMYKNLEYAVDKTTGIDLPPFSFSFPDHMIGKYYLIEYWYHKFCLPDLPRRKALLLYSKKRALGKTMFAMSLVNHESYVVVFRNNFNNFNIVGKIPKLLVLDDMNFYNSLNKETWKALVAGQKTAIRDCHCNEYWDYTVPCIITTNNLLMVKQMYRSNEFNTQVIMVEISDYIGPDGTQPTEFQVINHDLSPETLDEIDKMEERERLNYKK